MPLFKGVLKQEELDILDEIFGKIYGEKRNRNVPVQESQNRDLRLFIRRCFREFMLPDTIEDDTLSKLMEMPSKFYYRDYKLLAAAYDFVVERLAKHIEDSNSASEITKTFIRVRLEDLDLHRKTRLGGVDNLDADIDAQLNLLDHAQQVSARFIGEFFGYRRSATQDEIVRFTMKIAQVKDRNKVRYVNEYTRGGTHWRVSGAGYCVRDTLYLFGHAVSVNTPAEKQESLGLRFLALRELPDTRCLNGLVISMAGDGMPIAARVVLVPMERHKLSDESAALKRRSQSAWELLMIQHSPVYDADIVSQIGDAFVPRKVNYFLELIRNHTNSVLTGRPSEDSTISEKEESVRRFSRIMEESFDTVLSDRYRRFLEATITELENLAKGG